MNIAPPTKKAPPGPSRAALGFCGRVASDGQARSSLPHDPRPRNGSPGLVTEAFAFRHGLDLQSLVWRFRETNHLQGIPAAYAALYPNLIRNWAESRVRTLPPRTRPTRKLGCVFHPTRVGGNAGGQLGRNWAESRVRTCPHELGRRASSAASFHPSRDGGGAAGGELIRNWAESRVRTLPPRTRPTRKLRCVVSSHEGRRLRRWATTKR